MVIWKVSPAVTEADEESAPVQRQLPLVLASQSDQCVYVSVVETFVHSAVPDVAMLPLAAALHETTLRVASVAALFVPASPGSPVCSLM